MKMYPNPNNCTRAERRRHEESTGTRMWPDPNNCTGAERDRHEEMVSREALSKLEIRRLGRNAD